MDLFPLWNSLRIALISSIIVFFFRYFLRLLYRAAAEAYKRSAGRHPDAADGSPSYRSRLFSADAVCAGYADRFLGL